ncbi:MAG: response regulator [Acidobacteria bacterium]|nr:response regulator [Acidobacteriota bacterium]
MGVAEEIVTVLAVSPLEEDSRCLEHVFSHSKWEMHRVRTCHEALALLRQMEIPVIVCERSLPDGDWKQILAEASVQPTPPRIIVTSQFADDLLWTEVLDMGGYDVLGKPFDSREVVRVISLAWRQWKHEVESSRKKTVASAGESFTGRQDLRSSRGR